MKQIKINHPNADIKYLSDEIKNKLLGKEGTCGYGENGQIGEELKESFD